MDDGTCSAVNSDDACTTRGRLKRGMCNKHYCRWLKYGDPSFVKPGVVVAFLRRAIDTDTDECIILSRSYGRPSMKLNNAKMNASRAIWIMANGDPGELWVLHTCHRGIEGCVNLRHLYLGNQAQNMRDMDEAGRRVVYDRSGERNPRAKLNQAQVDEIRERHKLRDPKDGTYALAAEFGVSGTVISNLVNGLIWSDAESSSQAKAVRRKRLTREQRAEILARFREGGVSQQAVADEFGVSQKTVSLIVCGELPV